MAGDHDAFVGRCASLDRPALRHRSANPSGTMAALRTPPKALVSAWSNLGALRDDRFDAQLHRLLVRACSRSTPQPTARKVEVHVAAIEGPSSTRRRIPSTAISLNAAFAVSTLISGRCSCSITTLASRSTRQPMSLAFRPVRSDQGSNGRPTRCAPRSRRTPGPL